MAKKKIEETSKEENTSKKEKIIKEEIKEELIEYTNNHLRKELSGYIDEKIKEKYLEEIEKANRRVLKEKNKKILSKNIIIILLLGCIAFLTFQLYQLKYFDQFFIRESSKEEKVEKTEEEKEPVIEEKTPTLEELKEQYASLLDPYYLSSTSNYINDFYSGNLSSGLKKYFTLNNMNFNYFEIDEDYYVIEESLLKEKYQELFNDTLTGESFDYNGNKVRYIHKLESYMTDSKFEKTSSDIERDITEIKEENDKVFITTKEGVRTEEELHNVLNEEETLNTITYVFENKKLIGLQI